jgi:predicted transposase/invertase (TIGR01784 family)
VIAYTNLGKEERKMIDAAEKARDDIEAYLYTAREDGIRRGREDERREIAHNMKAQGVDSAIIAKSLNLTLKEVEELA